MTTLKLVSINVERSKHVDRVAEFLSQERPDVCCIQELMERDVERFSEVLGGASCFYEPSGFRPDEPPEPTTYGDGIFTSLPMMHTRASVYAAGVGELQPIVQSDTATYNCSRRPLLFANIEKEGEQFCIMTTHFTWTPDSRPNDLQRHDMQALLSLLEREDEFVLCGDFNAPRGGEIFSMLADKYRDNIPPKYTTSIDGSLHRAGPLPYMVDGLFSTPGYTVSGVKLVNGVSDHLAIVAEVRKS